MNDYHRPTDEEVLAIAREILAEQHQPQPASPGDSIINARHELAPEDEDRVIAALERLRASPRPRPGA